MSSDRRDAPLKPVLADWLPLADPKPRMSAYAVDLMITHLVGLCLLVGLLFSLPKLKPSWLEWLATRELDVATIGLAFGALVGSWMFLNLVVENVYFILFELLSSGQSIGKKALRLRVVRRGGRPINLWSSLIRNLMRFIDVLPISYLLGLVSMRNSRHRQRLGDHLAGTMVVSIEPHLASEPALGQD